LRSIVSSGRSLPGPLRAAAEGVGLAAVAAALLILTGGGRSAVVGAAAAGAASAVSVAWLLSARERSTKAFWRAFGGGMALRAAVLGLLAVWGLRRTGVSMEYLLLSYAIVLMTLQLTLDFRYLRLR
jgi:hypothetical protein